MKQLVFSNKTVAIVVICLLVVYCSSMYIKNDIIYNEEASDSYTISFIDSEFHEELKWRNNISYKIVNPSHMEDLSLELKVCQNIDTAMTSWICGKVLNADSANVEIYCHSNEYLSFLNYLTYEGNRLDYIHDYITIDMKTGERVMLNDIIRIDEDFVKFIQSNHVLQETVNDSAYGADLEMLNNYTLEELLNKLNECSMTQQQVIDKGYYSIEESIGSLINRNSFFLRENQLVIVLGYTGGEHHFAYDLDDISEFLKVEKW